MANKRHNQKCPPSPFHDDQNQARSDMYGDCLAKYETDQMGRLKAEYADTQSSKNGDTHAGITGHFWHHYQNNDDSDGTKDQVSTELHPAQHRFYSQSKSSHAGTHSEEHVRRCRNAGSCGDVHDTTASDSAEGATGKKVNIYSDEARISHGSNYAGTSDKTMGMRTTPGDNWSHGDKRAVDTRGDLDYGVINADWGRYVTGDGAADFRVENKDFQLQTGNGGGTLRLTSRKGDIVGDANKNVNIKAGQKITLTVGGSSITIEDGKITLKAGQIILDGETHCGGQGGTLAGQCGGGCATKTFVN